MRNSILVRLVRSAQDPLHQADMKRQHIVEAWKILLWIEVGWIGDDPPFVFVGNNTPNLIAVARDILHLHLFQVLSLVSVIHERVEYDYVRRLHHLQHVVIFV
jgi:hypothetical protein